MPGAFKVLLKRQWAAEKRGGDGKRSELGEMQSFLLEQLFLDNGFFHLAS